MLQHYEYRSIYVVTAKIEFKKIRLSLSKKILEK